MRVLCVNCGSATIKYKMVGSSPAGGKVELREGYREAVGRILDTLPGRPDAIAHRVVHGGDRFDRSVRIDDEVERAIEALCVVAPLHNPPALEGIRATRPLGLPMVAVFDTTFHRTLPEVARRYALPGIEAPVPLRRYGFHGISHQYVTERYSALTGRDRPTLISLHLGNGSSITAVREGRSVDTSMGFTPLEGLIMGTRSGDVDPGILLYLARAGRTHDRLDSLLNRESGLLGLAGTHDMRELLARDDAAARLAVEMYCYRAIRYVGAYLAVLAPVPQSAFPLEQGLGGAEALVFTGGIGENSPEIRDRICGAMAWAGLELDPLRRTAEGRISTERSKLTAWVIPTDEESVMARETCELLGKED